MPSSGCGTARISPDSMPSSVSTSSRAPDTASRPSRSPAVSRGPTVSVSTPNTGPASSSFTIWNVVAPVTSSPCSSACWTGAAPRQAGSTEKCRLTQPRAGMSSATWGSSAPYAVTGQQSGLMARSRSRNSGSRALTGFSTSSPASAPSRATGLASRCRPRPAGASGRVTTATTSWREASRPVSAATAGSGVPANTSRISRSERLAESRMGRAAQLGHGHPGPLGLADGLHGQLLLLWVQPVDEQHAVQVIGLVLEAAGHPLGALQRDRVPVHVEPLGHRAPGPFGREGQAGERQAALLVGVLLLGQVERGVDQVPQLVVDEVGEHPQPHTNLRRGQTGAGGVHHGVGEVLDQLAQFGIEITDRLGLGAQHPVGPPTRTRFTPP